MCNFVILSSQKLFNKTKNQSNSKANQENQFLPQAILNMYFEHFTVQWVILAKTIFSHLYFSHLS